MNFENLKNFMDHLTSWRIPGNTVRVYLKNKEVFRYSSGYSDLENKTKMNGDELFYIYSCSKLTTVTAAMQLLERGCFLLDDPLQLYIPEFRNMTVMDGDGNISEAKTPITVRNLFTMTAGFDYNFNREAFARARELTGGKMNTLDVIKCVASEPLCFNPGEKWQYSIGHDVLAALVEAVSGMKFRDYVRKNIFEPLGMNSSYYHASDEIRERMAQQYIFCESDCENQDIVALQSGAKASDGGYIKNAGKNNAHILGDEYDSGGAGIITCADDYVKLVSALANYGRSADGIQILSRSAVELMRTNQLAPGQSEYFNWEQLRGYGYGLGVRTMLDRAKGSSLSSIGEFGWGGAAGATVLADPETGLAMFYAHHMLNPQEAFYQPRLRNVLYSCVG